MGLGHFLAPFPKPTTVHQSGSTPQHPQWDRLLLQNEIGKKGLRVRISGWLFFDQYHQGDVTSGARGTLWEIHPIMKIEVQQPDNSWKDLDQCKTDQTNHCVLPLQFDK